VLGRSALIADATQKRFERSGTRLGVFDALMLMLMSRTPEQDVLDAAETSSYSGVQYLLLLMCH